MFAEIFALLAGTGNLAGALFAYLWLSAKLTLIAHPVIATIIGINAYVLRLGQLPREATLLDTVLTDFVMLLTSPLMAVVVLSSFLDKSFRWVGRRVRRVFTGAWIRERGAVVKAAMGRFWVWSKLSLLKAWLGTHLEWVVMISFSAVVIVSMFKKFLNARRANREKRLKLKGLTTPESARISARHMMAIDYMLNTLNIAAAIIGVAAFGFDGVKKAGFTNFVMRTWRSAMGSGAPRLHDEKGKNRVGDTTEFIRGQQEACSKILAEFQGVPDADLSSDQKERRDAARANEKHYAALAANQGKVEPLSIGDDAYEREINEMSLEVEDLSKHEPDAIDKAEGLWADIKKYGYAFACVGLLTALVVGVMYLIFKFFDEEEEVVEPKKAEPVVVKVERPPQKRMVFRVAEALGLTEKVPEARRYVNPSPDDFALNDVEDEKELRALMEAKLEEMLERRFGGYSGESQKMGIFNDERDPRAMQKIRYLDLLKKAIDAVKEKESEIVELESLTDDLALELTEQTSRINAMESRLREATAAKARLAEIEVALEKATKERDDARAALMKNDSKYAAHSVGFANSKIGDLELEQEKLRAQLEGKGKSHEGAKVCKGCNKPVDPVSPSAFCQECRKKRTQQKKQARASLKEKEKPAVKPTAKESDSLEAELLKLASPEDVKEALQVNSALFTPKNGSSCVKMVGILDGTSETHFKNGTIVNGSLITVKHGCNKALDVSTATAGHHGVAEGSVLPIPEVDMCAYPAPKGNWGPTPKVRRAKQGEKCFVAYYATPEATELTFGAHGTIQDVGDPVKRLSGVHTCSTQKGASGCGVWAESDGAFLGVHEGTKDGRNVFVPVDATQLGKALDGKAIAWPSRSGN